MAYQTPSLVQNENLHVHSGKGAVGSKVNVLKSEHKIRKERKALADISKKKKPSVSAASKVSLKDKFSVRCNENPKSIPKCCHLTEEEIKKCNEWAKEGIEYMHFSGNDLLSLEKDLSEKLSVEKEVEEVMSALGGWTQTFYGLERPMEEARRDFKDFMLEDEPEVFLPMPSSISTSGNEEIDDLFSEEDLWALPDKMFELKLKEEYVVDL
ncbi:uncharacterized protein LOC143879927 [Tasmannia lanceolata]|uniref:uncharacterized protein LOC143879927 n=1 Tax=Tasmannia lanceolata TaxID=3420 RepID=UPI004064B6C6